MGTTTQKLEYLGTTKSQLKDQINYGLPSEEQITSSTTFREYVGSIFEAFLEALRNPDTLFNNLPKTSGSGSQITLNGTANAPMRINPNSPAITQDGTPTPDNPQDIHLASGNNSVVVEGKNLFDKNTQNILNAYISGDSIIKSSTLDRSYWLKVNKNTTYTIKMTQKAPTTSQYADDFQCGLFAETPTIGLTGIRLFNRARSGATTDETFTETFNTNNYEYLLIKVGNTTRTNINESLDTLQLEKGSTATTYTPYISQTNPINLGEYELGTIGNYSNEFVRSGGENLFNPSDLVQGYLSNTLIDNRTTTARTDAILLKAGTYYYKFKYASEIWVKMVTYTNTTDTSGTYVFNSKSSNYTTTFTLTNDTYVRFGFDEPLSNITASATIMLSTKNIDYVPYEKGWYYKQGIGKVVLDGSINYIFSGSSSSPTDRSVVVTPDNFINIGAITYLSNRFAAGSTTSNRIVITNLGSTSVYISIEDSLTGITSGDTNSQKVEKIKTYLTNNETYMYYPLSTPTYTKITGELAEQLEQVYKGMLSYDGTTNISQVNNDLAFGLVGSAITK